MELDVTKEVDMNRPSTAAGDMSGRVEIDNSVVEQLSPLLAGAPGKVLRLVIAGYG